MPRGRNECYRIHFEVNYVGKMIKAAKRKVTWKFVFAGDKGAWVEQSTVKETRELFYRPLYFADEHSVVLMHTLNSGKKVIFLNGNQIFEKEEVRDDTRFTVAGKPPPLSPYPPPSSRRPSSCTRSTSRRI